MQGTRPNAGKIILRIFLESIPILLFAKLLAADQLSKFYVENVNTPNSYEVIKGFLFFDYAQNTGAAWSFLADKAWGQLFFKILTPISLSMFVAAYVYACIKNLKWLKFSLVLIIAGAVGNYIDRLAYNYVIDFISCKFGNYYFPTFNLADSFLVVGVIMLMAGIIFIPDVLGKIEPKKRKKPTEESKEEVEVKNDEQQDADCPNALPKG